MKPPTRRGRSTLLRGVLFASAIGFLSMSANAQLTGIGYNISPSGERTFFQGNAGLGDATMYGGRLGFSFGEFAELRATYLRSSTFSTDFRDFSGIDPATDALLQGLDSRDIQLQRYGGELKFNIGRGSIFPTISLGTGILRFDPDELRTSETVYLEGAVGIQFSVKDRYTLSIEARDLAYRYNPASTLLSEFDLADVGATADAFEQEQVNNLGIGVGLQLYLGGRSRGELTELDEALRSQFSGGLRGIRWEVEPFGSQIKFKSELGFRGTQRMGGVAAGADFGQYVGLRGFYWRGVEDGSVTDFDKLQAYGGEMRLGFGGEMSSIRPFVTLGGGYMDVLDDYQGNEFAEAKDRAFAMGGGGVVVPLGESLNIHASARALLMSTEGVDNVSDPSKIYASGMYTVGLSFSIGGRGRQAGRIFEDRLRDADATASAGRATLATRLSDRETELRRAEARLDSLAEAVVLAQEGDAEAIRYLRQRQAEQDSLLAMRQTTAVGSSTSAAAAQVSAESGTGTPATAATAALPATKTGGQGEDRWVTIPIPVEGELYVRYGTPGAVSVESLTGTAPEYVVASAAGPAAPQTQTQPAQAGATGQVQSPQTAATTEPARPMSAEEIAAIVRATLQAELASQRTAAAQAGEMSTLEKRIDDRLAAIERSLAGQRPVTTVPSTTIVQEPAPAVVTVDVRPGTRFVSVIPFTGVQIDNTPQVLLGARGDFRRGASSTRFIPEIVFGFGRDVAFGIHANAAVPFLDGKFFELRPYVGAGLGMTNIDGLELTLNLLLGVERDLSFGDMFVEFMTSDMLDYNRVAVGYRVAF